MLTSLNSGGYLMPRFRRWGRVALNVVCLSAIAGCAILDVFEPAGPGQIVFVYTGVTDLRVGDRARFSVAVQVEGSSTVRPRLRVALTDTTVVVLTASGDTLVAKKPGAADLRIWLEHSVLSGDPPDTTIALHVKGQGAP